MSIENLLNIKIKKEIQLKISRNLNFFLKVLYLDGFIKYFKIQLFINLIYKFFKKRVNSGLFIRKGKGFPSYSIFPLS
jgi:hypothetical protein